MEFYIKKESSLMFVLQNNRVKNLEILERLKLSKRLPITKSTIIKLSMILKGWKRTAFCLTIAIRLILFKKVCLK